MADTEMIKEGSKETVIIKGNLDSLTAPGLAQDVKEQLEGVTTLILDFAQLSYISSAGLRELLELQQFMDEQGEMIVENVSAVIKDVLDVSGFSKFMTIR